MEFIKALKNVVSKQKRKVGVRTYYSGGTVYWSRLFSYFYVNGFYEPDERYAPAIRTIFDNLAMGKTLPEIKATLDEMKARDSSNNRYSISRIIAIAERPIYCGYLLQRGRLVAVKNLTALVSLDTWKQAQKTLKIEIKKYS